MFDHWDDQARAVVVHAQEEARALRHDEIGTAHLLLGTIRVAPGLISVPVDRVRGAVIAATGRGEDESPDSLPFSARAMALFERVAAEVRAGVLMRVQPADLLRALRRAGGVAERVLADLGAGALPEAQPLRPLPDRAVPGDAVPVRLGDGPPIGDLGHPRVDGLLLLAVLAAGGPAAALLREHGIDEAAVRAATPVDPA